MVSLAEFDRHLVVAQDARHHRLGLLHQFFMRHDPRDHVGRIGPLGADRLAGQQHLQREADATAIDEADDAAIGRVHAAADLEGAELRALGGDADVAGHRQLDAMAHAPAVNGGDDRLVEPRQRTARDAAQPGIDPLAPHHGTHRLPFRRMSS